MAQDQILRLIELGVSQVNMNPRDIGLALAALAQEGARSRVAANPPAAITDSSTGVAITSLAKITLPSKVAKDGATTLVQKTEFDAIIGQIEDGHEELATKTNELIALIAGNTARTVPAMGGAAADGIISAISSLTGGTTNLVAANDALAQIVVARNNQAAIAAAVNYCRVAMGLSTLPDNTGGVFDLTGSAYSTTPAAATGAAVTADGDYSLDLSETDDAFVSLTDNIATMASYINAMRGTINIGPFVVATSNPNWKFLAADVTP